jgi:hypothetical protein
LQGIFCLEPSEDLVPPLWSTVLLSGQVWIFYSSILDLEIPGNPQCGVLEWVPRPLSYHWCFTFFVFFSWLWASSSIPSSWMWLSLSQPFLSALHF